MIHLSAMNLHYLGDTESKKRQDCCVHGNVFFSVNDNQISDGDEWCVSASALRFMRSVIINHRSGNEEHMIPCCGHFMIAASDMKTVQIIGCTNGIDFDIIHENNRVIIKTENGKCFSTDFTEYKNAVLAYANQIETFINNSPRRAIKNKFDKEGYNAFQTEWSEMKKKIEAIN